MLENLNAQVPHDRLQYPKSSNSNSDMNSLDIENNIEGGSLSSIGNQKRESPKEEDGNGKVVNWFK